MGKIQAYDLMRVKILSGVREGAVGKVMTIHPDTEKPLGVAFANGASQRYAPHQVEVIEKDREKYEQACKALEQAEE